MPGIFAQTLAFASATTSVGITDDMQKGLVDRFRSLPMVRSAFLTGRTIADVVYNAGILVVLMVTGLAVGWRVRDGVLSFLGRVRPRAAVRVRDELAGVSSASSRRPSRRRSRSRSPRSSRSRSCPTRSCRCRRCRAGCSRWPSGTR